MKATLIKLLQTRRFLPLFLTQFLGAFNDNAFKNAMAMLITYQLAKMAGMDLQILLAIAGGVFILPYFLFSATAGQLADKYERSRLIVIIKFFEIIIMCFAVAAFYLQNIYLLMFVLFALGTQSTFFGPLKYAILPDHLKENELIGGNGLIEAGTFIAILIGTLLGGLLILSEKGELLISIAVISIGLLGWISSWFIPKTFSNNPDLKINNNFIQETFRLIAYSKSHWDIFLAILGISWFWLIGAILLSEFPAYVKNTLNADKEVVTFFLALFSIGIAIGSLLCNKLLKGKVHATFVPLGAIGITIFTIDIFFATPPSGEIASNVLMSLHEFLQTLRGWRISLDLLLIAIFSGIYTVPLYAILQHRSAVPHRARVIASSNVMNALFMVVGAIVTVILLEMNFTVPQVFLIVGICNGFVAIYICKLLPAILIKAFFRALLTFFYHVKIKGLENYYQAGDRVVIIANHASYLDPLLFSAFLPEKLTYAVNIQIAKKWWFRLSSRLFTIYPMDPSNPMNLKSLLELLKQNKKVVIFPEGRLTVTGALMKIYEGPGFLADKSNAKFLPIRIEGAQYTPFTRLKGKVRIRPFPTITISVFPPQSLDIPSSIKGRERREIISSQVYDLMTTLMFESSDYRKTLFASLIDAKSMQGRSHEIIEDIQRKPLRYGQFIMRCFLAGAILKKKTTLGEYVGILLPNMTSSAVIFFALQAYSRIPVMLNFSSGINNILMACQTAKIKLVLTSRQFIRISGLSEMIKKIEAEGITIFYLETLPRRLHFYHYLKAFFMGQFPRLAYYGIHASKKSRHYLNSNSSAVVLFTSGSEGVPKGVVLSHSNIQANRFQLTACIDFNPHDIVMNALPIFHTFGLTGGMLLPLLSGVKVFLYPSPLHYRIIPELSYDIDATILFGTDTFLAGYAKLAHPYDFYSMRYVFSGAEKLRNETREIWSKKFGIRILEGYGATETSPILATNTPMQHKEGSVGRMLPGIQYKLIPVPGIETGGILVVFGPNIMKGYLLYENPGVIVPPAQGWYETGDIVSMDEMGFITIMGRVKRFAKIAGEMVSLTMVEQWVNQLWPENQNAILNIPDEKKGEQIILVTTNPNASREALVAFARENYIHEIAIPKKIIVTKEIPLLGTGKINYLELKKILTSS